MKFLVFLLLTMMVAQGRRVREVRSYAASLNGFYQLPEELDGVFDEPERLLLNELEVVEEAGFKSRFLGEGHRLRDLTEWGQKMMLIEESDHMVWNEASERLIAWADEEGHREIGMHFAHFLEVVPRFQIELMKSGVKVGEVIGSGDGKVVGEGRELEVEFDCPHVEGHVKWYAEVRLISRIEGAELRVEWDCAGCVGVPLVVDLGSPDGGDLLSVKVTVESLVDDEIMVRNWAVKEDGESPWWEEVMQKRFGPWQEPGLDPRKRVRRRIVVPRIFLDFENGLRDQDVDPFSERRIPKGSPKVFLEQNGVEFREGDWVVFYRKTGVLEVCVAPTQLFLVEGAFGHSHPGFHGLIRWDFRQVDAQGMTLKTIGLSMLEGSGSVGLGGDLKGEVEGVYEWFDESVELRVALTEVGDMEQASFRTRLKVAAGEPIELLRSFDGEWRSWVLTATPVTWDEFGALEMKKE